MGEEIVTEEMRGVGVAVVVTDIDVGGRGRGEDVGLVCRSRVSFEDS